MVRGGDESIIWGAAAYGPFVETCGQRVSTNGPYGSLAAGYRLADAKYRFIFAQILKLNMGVREITWTAMCKENFCITALNAEI